MSGGGYTEGIDIRAITWDRLKQVAADDDEMQTLVKTILNGFPSTMEELPPAIQAYWKVRSDL